MCGGKAGNSFLPCIDTFFQKKIEEKVHLYGLQQLMIFSKGFKQEQRTKMRHADGNIFFFKKGIQGMDKTGGAFVKTLLKFGALLLQMCESGFGRGHCQGMFAEGSCEKDHVPLRMGFISELPCSAVYDIHILRFSRDNADGHSAGNDFAVSHKISFHVKPCLCSARMDAEACDHFIKNKNDIFFQGQSSQLMEKFSGLKSGSPALYRLDENRCQFVGMRFDDFKRFGNAVIQYQNIFDRPLGRAGSCGHCSVFSGSSENTVGISMIRA